VEANLALGHQADERDYTIAALILADLGVESLRLLTNNPLKIEHLNKLGVPITQRVPLEAIPNAENAEYLFTKAIRMNHLLNLEMVEMASAKNGNGSNSRSG
jgi:3,4-dihydroxy 2-butanone 4-phosphate synthase/GTP cyclohydrolase II